jgi:hypothetical protein
MPHGSCIAFAIIRGQSAARILRNSGTGTSGPYSASRRGVRSTPRRSHRLQETVTVSGNFAAMSPREIEPEDNFGSALPAFLGPEPGRHQSTKSLGPTQTLTLRETIHCLEHLGGDAEPHKLVYAHPWTAYPLLRWCCHDFRSRTPGSPPFSEMNLTRAASRADRIAAMVAGRGFVSLVSSRAKFRTVVADAVARSSRLQPISARAARICAEEMSFFMLFSDCE